MYPMAFVNPSKGLYFTFADTFVLDEMVSFRAAMALPIPERVQRFADPQARAEFKAAWDDKTDRVVIGEYDTTCVAQVADPANERLLDRTVADIAAERGIHPMDAMLDIAISEDLRTVFRYDRPDQDQEVLRHLINHPQVLLGASDGGAHLTSFCGADFTTLLLTDVVGRGDLTFEAAVNKVTLQPATAMGLWDRGAIRPDAVADMVLVDRDRLGVEPIRFVQDFPANASRLVWEATGYTATIVAGEVIVENGKPTGATPGEVVRFNQG
jgi:N-acyl-D-aspartate/D-glutamate deacylase